LTKLANVNRANLRRTVREMEEANQKVDPSFHVRIKAIEQEIAELKLEIPRVAGLAEAAV